MKPLRIIERIAYGDGTPDELADEVPTWEALNMTVDMREDTWHRGCVWVERSQVDGWCVSFDRDGVEFPYLDALTEAEARWWAGVAIAYAAGRPPHWADMGMVPHASDFPSWTTTAEVGISTWPTLHGDWTVSWFDGDVHYLNVRSEVEARCWVADRLGVEWGAGS